MTLGGLYDFKWLVLGALVERAKSDTLTGEKTRNYGRIAGMVPVGPHEFHLNAGLARDFSGTSNTGGKQYTVCYNYNLSKRTKVYTFYTEIDNDKADPAVPGSGGAYTFLGSAPGLDNRSFAAGIRHNF